MSQQSHQYSIRQVIELTGMTEFLLRVWENRYGALQPKRTPTGRRLYSEKDVAKAKLLSDLTARGHKISHIAKKSLKDLNALLEENSKSVAPSETPEEIIKVFASAERFEWQPVREWLFEKAKEKDFVNESVLLLLKEMNGRIAAQNFSISQEHIMSALIKEALYTASAKKSKLKSKAKIVLAAPEGDFHDLGLLISASIAKKNGVETLFLGPNMPKRDLAETCVRYKATHILISSTVSKEEGAESSFLQFLNFLDRNLDKKITIWVAGRNTSKLRASLDRPFKILNSFADFEKEITSL